jgi:hypothetical protein
VGGVVLMAALGTIGTNLDIMPHYGLATANPVPHATGAVRNESRVGVMPWLATGVAGVPVDVVPIVVASYGQAAGGISIY